MADDKKKILIDVLVEASDSIKEISNMRKAVTDLKKAQKELDLTTEQGRVQSELHAAEIRTVNNEIRKKNKEVDNSIKQALTQKNSLESLSASLSNMKIKYRELSLEDQKSAEGKALQQAILATNDALRLTEEGYGQYIRDAANYRKANQKLTEDLKKLEQDLLSVSQRFLELSEEEKKGEIGKQLISQMNELRSKIDNTGASLDDLVASQQEYSKSMISMISNNNSLTGSLIQMSTSGGGVSGMLGAVKTQAMVAGKALLALAMNPVVLTLAAIVAVCALLAKAFQRNEENGEKLNLVFAKVGAVFQWLLSVLEPVATFLVDNLIIAFDALAEAVEWTINKIAAVMEFLGMESAAKWVRETTESIKEMTKAAEGLARAEAELRKEQREAEKIQKEYQKRAEKLKQLRDDDTKSIADRIKANEELGKVMQEQLNAELKTAQKALEIANLRVQVEGRTTENLDAQAKALEKIADIQERITSQESEQIKSTRSLQKEAADKALEHLTKTLEQKKALDQALIRAEGDFQTQDFAKRQEYDRRLQKLSADSEKEKLSLLRKYGKITEKEYQNQLSVLDAQQKEFYNSQIKGLNDYFKEQMLEISSMVDKSVNFQIQDVKNKYAKAIQDLSNIQEPVKLIGQSDEDFEKEYGKYRELMFERAILERDLEKQLAKDIEEIKEASLQKQISEIEKSVNKQYETDLNKFTDNQLEKNRVETQILQETIQKKKAANISVFEDEAQLRALTSQANQIQLNTELLQANENARAKYEAKKTFLLKESELYKDNADKQLEINEKLKQNEQQLYEARLANAEKWKNATGALLSSMTELARATSEAEIQALEEAAEQKKAIYQSQLDQGIISQEEHDKKVADLDAQLDKEKAEIELKQAKRERLMKIFSITTDTAMGVAKAVAMSPLTFGMPWSAFVGVTGAVQLAALMAQPLPKAARGGLIGGKPHSQGGTILEAEQGEAIINKRSTKMFAPILSLINEVGGGVPFGKPMSDGGFAMRANKPSQNNGSFKEDMIEAMKSQSVYLAVEDYQRADNKYAAVKDIGRNNNDK